MKTFISIILVYLSIITVNAQSLGIIESKNSSDIYNLFKQKNITVHFYNDDFAIISGEYKDHLQYSILEENGFDNEFKYFIQYANEKELLKIKESISEIGEILYTNKTISILKISKKSISQFKPIKNDALVYFDENAAFIADEKKSKFNSELSYNDDISSMLTEVNTDSIESTISYLSSFTTRDCYSAEVITALHWISSKFESYGLSITTQSLSGYGIPSFNVIATQVGETNPDEYVIVGGHADSRSSDATAPGADDNASGVAGVLEIARILSENTYDRTIIYCTFSGEEYGLFGSKYFATDFRNNDKNIIGYVNLDMIGYKASSQSLHTSLIYPSSAKDLADYYRTICSIYLPNFGVIDGTLIAGSSDHASFNNYGYMGIFPFEDVNNYSPYIHSSNDIIGLSVNSLELAENLTSAALATVASLGISSSNVTSSDNGVKSNDFRIYPNPATTDLNISFDNQHVTHVEIYNIIGELMIKKTIEASGIINVSELTTGTYFVKLVSKDYSSVRKCIIKGN
ncbi:MAG: M28 family peptidase [Bacteroidales bacterium]|jgi:leucyl aminopeptidase|nr:M28 family peptidase [Bacteroidales bacterium]